MTTNTTAFPTSSNCVWTCEQCGVAVSQFTLATDDDLVTDTVCLPCGHHASVVADIVLEED